LAFLRADKETHVEAARLFRKARQRGHVVPAADALIAATALAYGTPLLTTDWKHFRALARLSKLRLAEIVHDHTRSVGSQHQGMLSADATAGTRHDGHASFAELRHGERLIERRRRINPRAGTIALIPATRPGSVRCDEDRSHRAAGATRA